MIVRKRLPWLRMLLVWRGSILRKVLPQLFVTIGCALVVMLAYKHGGWQPGLSMQPFSLLGIAMAIFLGFRNNASYERFWEARKAWGALLNECRTLARQVLNLTDCDDATKRRMVYLIIAFVHALRHQLRSTDATADMNRLLENEAVKRRVLAARFKPAVILVAFGDELAAARRSGKVEPILAAACEPTMAGLSTVLGTCERIANTPIPFTYSVIIHRVIYLFALLLPFGLVEAVGAWTPVIVGFSAYMFFTLEALSDEIEEPFGMMPNDLALDAMSAGIEATVRETLGEVPLPVAPEPVDYVLS
ncbi:MAG: bestrophin family ion channel [Opitutaceae bacterium]